MSINAPFTKEEYLKMFSASPAMHGSRAKLLRFHFAQKNYLASAPEMAKAMGFASFSAASLQYGTFARELAKSIGWSGRIGPRQGLRHLCPCTVPGTGRRASLLGMGTASRSSPSS